MNFFKSVCSQGLPHLCPPKINLKRFIYNKKIYNKEKVCKCFTTLLIMLSIFIKHYNQIEEVCVHTAKLFVRECAKNTPRGV